MTYGSSPGAMVTPPGRQRAFRRGLLLSAIAGACLVAVLVIGLDRGQGGGFVLEDSSQDSIHNRAKDWSKEKVMESSCMCV